MIMYMAHNTLTSTTWVWYIDLLSNTPYNATIESIY